MLKVRSGNNYIEDHRETELTLEDSTERLKESNRALEDFAHTISHDLQEPLILIQAYSQKLKNRADKGFNQQCGRYVEQINSAAGHMSELINGLLLYSKVSNKTEPFVPVELSVVVDDVLNTFALQTERSKSTITKDRLPVILGAPLQIHQLFQNIIGNSLKYRNKDILHEIDIRHQDTVQQENGPNLAQISIRDNGIGFEPEAGKHIFDIFERLQNEKEVEGTGLGLAICKKIVLRHGGKILATGQPNKGAEFTLWLPTPQQ